MVTEFDGEKYAAIQGDGCHLGAYSTKEKALLVLNYIQSEIQRNVYDKQMVFEMPTDEDVEV